MTSVSSEYNLLNDCKYIRNKDRCLHDTNKGFEANFSTGNCGFTNNSGLDWHQINGKFFWANATASSCYVSLSEDLTAPFEADYFSDLEVDLLVRYNSYVVGKTFDTLTGKIAWRMKTDPLYGDDACVEFDVYPDGVWHHYKVNLLENPWWVGNCIDVRLYPFIDGAPDMEVIIQRIAFTSSVHYKCNYPPCAYNRHYKHPCIAVGTYAKATSSLRKNLVEVNDDHCRIGVSFEDYPTTYVDLDLNHCSDCYSIAQDITLKINNLSYGGYKFAECQYNSIEENFSIYTGTKGRLGKVSISPGNVKDVTKRLGFFSEDGSTQWAFTDGTNPADGYIPAYQRVPATLLYRLPSSEVTLLDFNPNNPLIQIGRSDIMALPMERVIDEGNIGGILFVDIFGRANDEGYINYIQFKGKLTSQSKVYLLRQTSDWTFTVVDYTTLKSSNVKRGQASLYEKAVNWYLRPGDILALYMCCPALHIDKQSEPRLEMIYKNSWIEIRNYNIAAGDTITFTTNDIKFYGFQGLPVYGFSTRKNPGFGIETELRYEYGVKEVAIIGDDSIDVFDFNLMDLEGTKYRVSTNISTGSWIDVGNMDLLLDFSGNDEELIEKFWVDFWFPGYIHGIYRMITTYEDSNNIRSFCWEAYIEPSRRAGLNWSGFYKFVTVAPYLGSEVGWVRLLDPAIVYTNDNVSKTDDLYLGFNYATYQPWDYYPGIDDTVRYNRSVAGINTFWNKLDQMFNYIETRGLRLYVWDWSSPRITSVDIRAYFYTEATILRSIDAYGYSGPLVFDTESYNIIDVNGEIWSSSKISRAKTTEYQLDMNFEIRDNDNTTIIAVVGTTLSKFTFDIVTYPSKVKQVKLIPQHIAQQLRTAGREPQTEIQNLSWGSPSTDVEFTYGPAQQYELTNDTGHRALLHVGVADPLAIDQSCVFSSDLNSLDSLDDPYRGSKAHLISSPDTPITNHRCVNYHARAYSVIPTEPVAWYSSSTSGSVWQLLVSGNPFTDPLKWNEPTDPNNGEWKIMNWCRAEGMTVSGGSLNITQMPTTARSAQTWMHPTYFQDTDRDSAFTLEAQVLPITPQPGTNVSVGVVIVDNTNLDRFFRVERFSGNSLLTQPGYTVGTHDEWDVPLGDYIRYGSAAQYYTTSGVIPPVYPIENVSEHKVLVRLIKDKTTVNLSWRMPWTTWTTVSSADISGWSNNIRIGVFGAAEILTRETGYLVESQIDYISSRKSDNKVVEDFSYNYDFSYLSTLQDNWTAVNAQHASIFSSSVDGLRISFWRGLDTFFTFDYRLMTPALITNWGSTSDIGTIYFRMSEMLTDTLLSGNLSAGFLLRNPSNHSEHIKFAFIDPQKLELTISGTTNYVNLTTPIDAFSTSSGVWFKIYKGTGIVIPQYSYDGDNYTIVSGIDVSGWTNSVALEACLSSNFDTIWFDNIQVGTSQLDSNALAAQFSPPLPLLSIYGQGTPWTNLKYSSSLTDTLSGTRPDLVDCLFIEKDQSVEVDVVSCKFMPSPKLCKQYGYSIQAAEIYKSNQQLFDYGGQVRLSDGTITASGAGWSTSDSLTYKGIAQCDFPLVAFDLGQQYNLGRSRFATNAIGTFSRSDTPYFNKVDWDTDSYEDGGFYRKCLLSDNKICGAGNMWGKPHMIYAKSETAAHYFAGTCDGWITAAGNVNRACPLYTAGQARWILLQSKDYYSTTMSAGNMWFCGPIEAAQSSRPLPIASNFNWWTTDFGSINWTSNTVSDPDYAIIYSYPGFNTEGTCYFNGIGSPYWKLTLDPYWSWEDSFCVDLKVTNAFHLNHMAIKVGRDPNCYYEFTVTGTLGLQWKTHEWKYKDGQLVVVGETDPGEPLFNSNDLEYYSANEYPYLPLPFYNLGYIDITVSGNGGSNIYFKNLTNKRNRFLDEALYLGLEESLYIPDIDIMNTGTIKFTYYPSLAALNLEEGDPRGFTYTLLTVSNPTTGICVTLDLMWGWTVYCFSPKEQLVYTCFPSLKEAERIIPTKDNPGPFDVVLSWAPPTIPGLNDTVVLWVNGIKTAYGVFESMGDYFTTDDVRVTLGRGAAVFTDQELHPFAAYAGFSNLQIYKRAVSVPDIDLDSTTIIPENLLELSKDGEEWHSFTSGSLPLLYTGINSGETRTFYMRNRRPQAQIKKLYKRDTAYLMVKWEVNQ
jgi:hypothetical protein